MAKGNKGLAAIVKMMPGAMQAPPNPNKSGNGQAWVTAVTPANASKAPKNPNSK